MFLYKYRSMATDDDLRKLREILANQQLHCSEYRDLNDPFEGQFLFLREATIEEDDRIIGQINTPITDPYFTHFPSRDAEIRAVLGPNPPRICSLCSCPLNMRMWSLYSDSHAGVAIEISAEGLGAEKVTYHRGLPRIDAVPIDASYRRDILLKKTRDWAYEKEFRLLKDQEKADIRGRITRILLGCRFEKEAELTEILGGIPTHRIKLDRARAKLSM